MFLENLKKAADSVLPQRKAGPSTAGIAGKTSDSPSVGMTKFN